MRIQLKTKIRTKIAWELRVRGEGEAEARATVLATTVHNSRKMVETL